MRSTIWRRIDPCVSSRGSGRYRKQNPCRVFPTGASPVDDERRALTHGGSSRTVILDDRMQFRRPLNFRLVNSQAAALAVAHREALGWLGLQRCIRTRSGNRNETSCRPRRYREWLGFDHQQQVHERAADRAWSRYGCATAVDEGGNYSSTEKATAQGRCGADRERKNKQAQVAQNAAESSEGSGDRLIRMRRG